jgi:hypothetical protein
MEHFNESDNTRLNFFLNEWGKNPSGKNFEKVMDELVSGNSYLLLPSIAETLGDRGFAVAKSGTKLPLTCIYEVDGIRVLGAFTHETSLYNWAKTSAHYIAMRSKAILKMCEMNDIYKIVINSDSPDTFLVQRKGSK